MVGQDGGQSIDLGNSTLFVFSDTLLTSARDPARGVSSAPPQMPRRGPCLLLANCAAVSEGGDIHSALDGMRYLSDPDGFPMELLVPTGDERAANLRFWPSHGLVVNGTVFLYYVGIERLDPDDPFGFRPLGVGLATVDPGTGAAMRIRRDGNWCLWPSRSDDFHFGVQVVREGDHVYVFGSHRRGVVIEGIVGRVPAAQMADPAAYTYLAADGESWVADEARAASLGPCASDYSVAYNDHLGAYLMAYVDGYGKELVVRVADDLCGPYSDPQPVGRLAHHPSSELIYLGFQHPKFAAEDGRRVYVSYCQPSFAMTSLVELRLR